MIIGILVGFIGMAFHMNAVLNPLGHLTWTWLVFGSPILAPFAFSGISLIGIYAITEELDDQPGMLKVPGLEFLKLQFQEINIFCGWSVWVLVQVLSLLL